MKKSKQAKNFIQRPSYPGGRAAINELIKKEIRYPKKALEAKVEGKVRVAYSLNHKGEVIRAKVEKGLGHGCDEEAIRLVYLLRFNVPKNRGMKVTFNKTITINFKLPKQKLNEIATSNSISIIETICFWQIKVEVEVACLTYYNFP